MDRAGCLYLVIVETHSCSAHPSGCLSWKEGHSSLLPLLSSLPLLSTHASSQVLPVSCPGGPWPGEQLGGYVRDGVRGSLGDKCVFLSFSPLPPLLHGLPLYQHWKVLFDQVCEQLNPPSSFQPSLKSVSLLCTPEMVTCVGAGLSASPRETTWCSPAFRGEAPLRHPSLPPPLNSSSSELGLYQVEIGQYILKVGDGLAVPGRGKA